jgi:hypothetical protein
MTTVKSCVSQPARKREVMKQYDIRLSPKKKTTKKKIVGSLIMPSTKVVRINSALMLSVFFSLLFLEG